MPPRIEIKANDRFGRLVVIRELLPMGNGRLFECLCDCGKSTPVSLKSLRNAGTKSCGCLQREHAKRVNRSHGLYKSRLHSIWMNMKQRCYNINAPHYPNYGGKGVSICDQWRNDFKAFYDWAVSSGYEDHLTIDRKDFKGDYEPSNCRWITLQEQNLNTSRSRNVTYSGKTMTLKEWSDVTGIKYKTLAQRLDNGLPVDRALSEPNRKGKKWN